MLGLSTKLSAHGFWYTALIDGDLASTLVEESEKDPMSVAFLGFGGCFIVGCNWVDWR